MQDNEYKTARDTAGYDYKPNRGDIEDELQSIIDSKQSFMADLITMKARFPQVDISELAGLIEDGFDDAMTPTWNQLYRERSEYPDLTADFDVVIPGFEELAENQGITLPFKVGNR